MAVHLTGGILYTSGSITLRGGGEVNQAPTDILLSNAIIAEESEQGAPVGVLTATDPNTSDVFTFSLVEDAGGRFQIVGNELQAGPVATDREVATMHTIIVRVTDRGGLSYSKEFVIQVAHVNKAPTDIHLSNSSIAENSPEGTIIGILSAVDPDDSNGFTYSLVDTIGSRFKIVGNELQAGPVATDYELFRSHTITVRVADDDGATYSKQFVIDVIDINEAPSNITLSNNIVDEFSEPGFTIGVFDTIDPDSEETFTYEILDTYGDRFQIVANELQTGPTQIVYADGASYIISIKVTDSGSLSYTKAFTINVNSTPVNITLSSNSVNETASVGFTIGSFSTIDPDGLGKNYTYTLLDDAGGRFSIFQNQLRVAAPLDYETDATHEITVRSSDGGSLSVEKTFTIIVRDVPEAPYDLTLSGNSIIENSPEGTLVGYLQGYDQDATGSTFTYTFWTQNGAEGRFKIVGNELQAGPVKTDYETETAHQIYLQVTDATGRYLRRTFTISVLNENEPPSNLTLSPSTLPERSSQGTRIGTLTATDPDAGETFTFELVDDHDGLFQIVGNELQAGPNPADFVTASSHAVPVKVIDSGGLELIKNLTVNVQRVWREPTDIVLDGNSVEENSPADVLIGTLSAVDPDIGDAHTFTLIANGSSAGYNTKLKIVGNALYTNATAFDFETDPNPFNVTIRATDTGGRFLNKTLVINIVNRNEAPTTINFNGSSFPERSPQGTLISTMTTLDPDVGDTHTYTLVDDFGGVFQINGNRLEAGPTPADGYLNPSYTVAVVSTDSGGLSVQRSLTVSVTRVWQAPTDINITNIQVPENSPNNTVIGTLSAVDPDQGDTFTFAMVASGSSSGYNTKMKIVGDQLLCNSTAFNYEVDPNPFFVTIRVTDRGSNPYLKTFALEILDRNEAPTNITLSPNNQVPEGTAEGFLIGNLAVVDPDVGDSHTLELLNDLGGHVKLVGNQLLTGPVPFDYEELSGNPTVEVRATDSGGLNVTRTFTIVVTNVNEAPTDIVLSATEIAEGAFPNTTIATMSAVDPDSVRTAQTFTFSLEDNSNGHFGLTGNALRATSTPLNADVQNEHTITLKVADQGNLTFTKNFNILIKKSLVPFHVGHTYGSTGTTILDIPYPEDIQEGDLIISYVGFNYNHGQATNSNGLRTFSDPSYTVTLVGNQTWGGVTHQAQFAYKIASGTETGSLAWGSSINAPMQGSIHVYRNVDTNSPLVFANSSSRQGSWSSPFLSPVNSHQYALIFGSSLQNLTAQAPGAPWTNIINSHAGFSYFVSETQMTTQQNYQLTRTYSGNNTSAALSISIHPKLI